MDAFHWLRHDWGKWEPYTQEYMFRHVFGGIAVGDAMQRSRIRQKRTCAICGATQDVVVAELHE